MIRLLLIFSIQLFIATTLFASQSLTFTLISENDHSTVLQYPADTDYEVLSLDGQPIDNPSNNINIFPTNSYKLVIQPYYNETPDVFQLKATSIMISVEESTISPVAIDLSTFDFGRYNGGVKLTKVIVPSKVNKGEFNCVLMLDNGVEFLYIDGEAAATYKDQILEIQGNHIIESPVGTVKLSYDPVSGEVWYFVEN